ncbi:MAG TPA: hypothetical protein VD907_00175 [Verrucomicrobiae bacterium]|nr:hypothetical protein [Verrucomicrobiae bacterium]
MATTRSGNLTRIVISVDPPLSPEIFVGSFVHFNLQRPKVVVTGTDLDVLRSADSVQAKVKRAEPEKRCLVVQATLVTEQMFNTGFSAELEARIGAGGSGELKIAWCMNR